MKSTTKNNMKGKLKSIPGQGMKQVAANPQQMEAVRQQLIAQQFDGRFQIELEKQMFPADRLTDQWLAAARVALSYSSPIALGVASNKIRRLVEMTKTKEINLFDFATLSNNLENRTANELALPIESYLDLMDTAADLSTVWNEISAKLRTDVIESIEADLKMKQAEPTPTGRFGGPVAEA